MKTVHWAIALCLATPTAIAQDASVERTKQMEQELAELTARLNLFSAQYPKLQGGIEGKVTNQEQLLGMVTLLVPDATKKLGDAIARQLEAGMPPCDGNQDPNSCACATVVLDSATVSEKLILVESLSRELKQLSREVAAAQSRKDGETRIQSVAIPLMALSAISSYAGLFRTDYSLSGNAITLDKSWLISAMLVNHKNLQSERFPDRGEVDRKYEELRDLERDISKLPKGKKNDELQARFESLRKAMITPGSDGVLPIVSMAMLTSAAGDKRNCLAIIIDASTSPILLTKQSMFSKGGRAYVYAPFKAAVVQLDRDGRPFSLICKSLAAKTSILLSSLTKSRPDEAPWATDEWKGAEIKDCGSEARSM